MSGFLYFVPGAGGAIERGQADELGIGYAFTGPINCVQVMAGPDGRAGMIIVDRDRYKGGEQFPVAYAAARQRWQKITGTDAWVGAYSHNLPGPSDLATGTNSHGGAYTLALGDGREWLIRVCRQPADSDGADAWELTLPRQLTLGDDGTYQAGDVVDDFLDANEAAAGYLEIYFGDDVEARAAFDVHAAAVKVLSSTYRVGMAEVVLLGLLNYDGEQSHHIMQLAIDLPSWGDIQKKRAEAGGDLTAGDVD